MEKIIKTKKTKKGKVGRKPLPADKRKVHIQIYALPKTAEKIQAYANKLLEEEGEKREEPPI